MAFFFFTATSKLCSTELVKKRKGGGELIYFNFPLFLNTLHVFSTISVSSNARKSKHGHLFTDT